jgi:hypothetical protein
MVGVERLAFGVGAFFVFLLLPDFPALPALLVPLVPEYPALLPLAEVAFVAADMRIVPREDAGCFGILARCSIRVVSINRSLGSPTALLACPRWSFVCSLSRLAPLCCSMSAMTGSLL